MLVVLSTIHMAFIDLKVFIWKSKYSPLVFFKLHGVSDCVFTSEQSGMSQVSGRSAVLSLPTRTDTFKTLIVYPLPLIEWYCLWKRDLDSRLKITEAQENLDQDANVNKWTLLGYGK